MDAQIKASQTELKIFQFIFFTFFIIGTKNIVSFEHEMRASTLRDYLDSTRIDKAS